MPADGERELTEWFDATRRAIEGSYLTHENPIRQSGFSGGPERWRREREPILDVGCANGYLLASLVAWARERGRTLVPFGVDYGAKLIDLARARMPAVASHFTVANAWDWNPPKRFRYVYALLDCVPERFMGEFARRLLARVVAPRGRLIAGHYGSRSRGIDPLPVAELLDSWGFAVAGSSSGGTPPITRFAWVDRP